MGQELGRDLLQQVARPMGLELGLQPTSEVMVEDVVGPDSQLVFHEGGEEVFHVVPIVPSLIAGTPSRPPWRVELCVHL